MDNLPLPSSKFPKSVGEYPFSPTTRLLFGKLDIISGKINPTAKKVASNELSKKI